jgi:hypothetical protein
MPQTKETFLEVQNRRLDAPTFLDCRSTLREWLEYHHSLGRKAIATPAKNWHGELLNDDGEFYAMLDEYLFDYFESLGETPCIQELSTH